MRPSKMGWAAACAVAIAGCSSGSDAPARPAHALVARGGTGSDGAGGSGAPFTIYASAGSDIRIRTAGTVDARFDTNVVMPDLGENPRTIATDATLTADAPSGAAPYTIVGDDGATPATGLWVKPGATLTLEANVDWDGIAGGEAVVLHLSNGAYVEGTVATGRRNGSDVDTADLQLVARNVVLAKSARVELAGLDATTGDGGTGGTLGVYIEGTIVNAATIVTTGGRAVAAGANGGRGGDVDLDASVYGLWNTGDLTTSGGASAAGAGGDAGGVQLYGSGNEGWGGGFSSGTIVSTGGDGATAGGRGGSFYLTGYYNGSTVSSSDVDTSGGHARVDGAGGEAGEIGLETWTGDVTVSGTLVAHGGNGAGTGAGGRGGQIYFGLYDDAQTFGGLIAGKMTVGADLDASGGDGATGGDAGQIWFEVQPSRTSAPGSHTLELVGVSEVNVSGGNGTTAGGAGGQVSIDNDLGIPEVVGGIRVEAPIVSRGGDARTGAGGAGGGVDVYTSYADGAWGDSGNSVPSFDRATEVTGAIDASGGAGTSGGNAGDVLVYDHFRTAAAAIAANGGKATDGQGGTGGEVRVLGDTEVHANGALAANGGDSAAAVGGAAGRIDAWGFLTHVAKDVSAIGGAGATGGGAGGFVDLLSTGNATAFDGTARVAGGAGAAPGDAGHVRLDGVDVALTNGAFHL